MSQANPKSPPDRSEPLRTVTPAYHGGSNWEMDVIGWLYFLGLLVIILPLLPFLIALWLVDRALDRLANAGE